MIINKNVNAFGPTLKTTPPPCVATHNESEEPPSNYNPLNNPYTQFSQNSFIQSNIVGGIKNPQTPNISLSKEKRRSKTTEDRQSSSLLRDPQLLRRFLTSPATTPTIPIIDSRIEKLRSFLQQFKITDVSDADLKTIIMQTPKTVASSIATNTPLSERFKQIVFYTENKTPILVLIANKKTKHQDPQLGSRPHLKKVYYGLSVPLQNPNDPTSSLHIVTTGPSYPPYIGIMKRIEAFQDREREALLLENLASIEAVAAPCAKHHIALSKKNKENRIYSLFPYFSLGDLFTYTLNRHFIQPTKPLPHENRINDWNIAIQCIEYAIELHTKAPLISLRDLKLDNIFLHLGDANRIEVRFGDLEPKDKVGDLSYTPGFAPPERFENYDPVELQTAREEAGIVWELGCILYLLLIGKANLPFPTNRAPNESMVQKLRCDTPIVLGDLIKKMLSIKLEERPTLKEARTKLLQAYYAEMKPISPSPNKKIDIVKKEP